MGWFKKLKKAAKSIVKDTAKAATFGAYNPDTGSINFNVDKMGDNFAEGVTYSGTATELGLLPKPPKLPEAESEADQADRARAAAESKMGNEKRGLASTMLGGSLGEDSNLKKKKLLGE